MKQKGKKAWIKFLRELIFVNKMSAFGCSVLILMLSIVTIIKANIVEKLIDVTAAYQWSKMLQLLAVLIVIVIVNIAIKYWEVNLSTYFSASSSSYMKNNICHRILYSRYEDISAESGGDVLKTINDDVENVSSFLRNDMVKLLSQFVMLVGVLIYLFVKNPIIGLVTFSYTPIGMYITYHINKKMGTYYPKMAEAEGKATGALEQVISQIAVVKVLGMGECRLKKVKDQYWSVQQYGYAAAKYHGMLQTACSMVSMVPRIIFYIFSAWLVLNGKITLGAMIAIDQLLEHVIAPTVFFPFMLDHLNHAKASISRIQELCERLFLEDVKQNTSVNKSDVVVELKEVNFSFGANKIFNNFNLKTNKCGIIVVSGKSGSGKTTLFDLIAGIYKPSKGNITIKGKVYSMTQDTYLFNGTVIDNVRCVKPDATDEEVLEALEKACVSDWGKSLSDGYHTRIGDGNGELSGGQKQRIGLARAFMTDAQIILLDEPTSSLDEETEKKIIDQIELLSKEKIIFIAAHRDSLFKIADRRIAL